DSSDLLCRYWSLLHYRQEQAYYSRQDRNQEVRSGCTQARDLQGRQDQVRSRSFCQKTRLIGGFFVFCGLWLVACGLWLVTVGGCGLVHGRGGYDPLPDLWMACGPWFGWLVGRR